jgi:beta-lactamase class C
MIKIRKKIPISLFLSLILLFPFTLGTHSNNNTAQKKLQPYPELQPLIARYENFVRRSLTDNQIPGIAVVIVKDSLILYIRGFGVKEVGTEDSLTIHTVFRLASLSKGFASVLTGVLVSEGLLSWHDRIVTYLPDFTLKSQDHAGKITIAHLLSHTTGLPYHAYTNLIEYGRDLAFIRKKFKEVDPIAEPGEVYSYQNAAYSLISDILATVSGKSYSALLQEKIFDPLNMTDASGDYESIKENPDAAKPHRHGIESYREVKISTKYYNALPAGGINASISDMSRWLLALLGNRPDIISKETLEEIFHPVIKTPLKYKYGRFWTGLRNAQYALGWRIFDYAGQTLAYHGGYVNGYRSEIALNREEKIAICVLTNAPSHFANTCIPTFFNMYKIHMDSLNSKTDSLAEAD